MDINTLFCIGAVALIMGVVIFYLLGNQGGDVWSREDQKRHRGSNERLNEVVLKAGEDRADGGGDGW